MGMKKLEACPGCGKNAGLTAQGTCDQCGAQRFMVSADKPRKGPKEISLFFQMVNIFGNGSGKARKGTERNRGMRIYLSTELVFTFAVSLIAYFFSMDAAKPGEVFGIAGIMWLVCSAILIPFVSWMIADMTEPVF